MSAICLINFNARVYDPTLARFLSADPMVGSIFDLQQLNRYSYVTNNPLSLTDPSGMCFLGCFWNQTWFRAIAGLAVGWGLEDFVLPQLEAGLGATAAGGMQTALGFVNAGIAGGASGAITTGTLKGAALGALEAGLFHEAGNLLQGKDGFTVFQSHDAGAFVLHGLVGGIVNAANGRDFTQGFLAAGMGTLGQDFYDGNGFHAAVASVTLGGMGSVLGGGKFLNGAETAAYAYLYNAVAHSGDQSGPTLSHPGDGNAAFVGGFFDFSTNGPAVTAYNNYVFANPDAGAVYFTWDQAGALGSWIDANGGWVEVFGHSYGGDTAASVVAAGHPVFYLATIDPVSLFRPDFAAVRANASFWIDYNATGGSSTDSSNMIAGIGGAWNTAPASYATVFVNLPTDHAGAMSICTRNGC